MHNYWTHSFNWASYSYLIFFILGEAILIYNFNNFYTITLTDTSIRFGKRNTSTVVWNQRERIYFDNHTINLFSVNDETRQIDVNDLNYNQRQSLKQNLRQFADEKNIDYQSKY